MSSYNKIQLSTGEVLIDLTSDTVDSNKLLYGYSAHKSDGTIISGNLFENYPDTETLIEEITDSSDINITDSTLDKLLGDINYRNNRIVEAEIKDLQIQATTYQQAYTAEVAKKEYIVAHCLVDSSGSMIDIS